MQIGEGRIDKTVPVAFSSSAGMDVGRDNGLVVGTVKQVTFDLKPANHDDEQDLHEQAAMQAVGQGAAG